MAGKNGGKRRRKWPWVLLVLALLAAAAVYFGPKLLASRMQSAQPVGSYTVGRGDVEVTITGSGKLEAETTVDIKLPEGVRVETLFVEAGDVVAAGDVLATLDASSLRYRAAELSGELTALDARLGARRTTSAINAPVRGRVKFLPAQADEDVVEAVNRYGALAILSTDELMEVEFATDAALALNTEVSVQWAGGTAEGKVASRVEGGYLVTLPDDEAPYHVQADVYDGQTLLGAGTLEIHTPVAIFGNGGTISQVEVELGDRVSANGKLFTLDNEPATDAYRQTLADRDEKAAQLQAVLRYQKSPSLVAEAGGVVGEVRAVEGQKTIADDDAGEMTALTLHTGGAVLMTIHVDELDVSAVAVGQGATITLDAFSTEEFAATVTRISRIGEPSGSITTYQTDLRLDYDERLLDGMNGSAVILADRAENVLLVPLAAIHEDAGGSYVNLLDANDAVTKLYITTGLSDGTNAEVTVGLREGDRIQYTDPNAASGFPFGFGGGNMRMPGMMTMTGGGGDE